jgi:hypothetical protein
LANFCLITVDLPTRKGYLLPVKIFSNLLPITNSQFPIPKRENMSDKPIFDIKQSTFEKLKKWQQKMEEKNRLEAEEELEKKPTSDGSKSSDN